MAEKTVARDQDPTTETRILAAKRASQRPAAAPSAQSPDPKLFLLKEELEGVGDRLAEVSDLMLESQLDGSGVDVFQDALVKLRGSRIVIEGLAHGLPGRAAYPAPEAGAEEPYASQPTSAAPSPVVDNFDASAFGCMFGNTLGEAYRYVCNELSTLLATTEGKQGYGHDEFMASLDQLRVRCGTAAEWSDRLDRKAGAQ